ncbi:MAG: alpha/beta hydrolase [Phycisphaeraceae bacterium]|nr:MAG: alpha/beta hydrolase [Phycisphaeraceae bacterium]
MRTERVEFAASDGHTIVGMLDLPKGDFRAIGIFAHCFTCSKNLRIVREVGKALTDEGLALLRFDFTGLGHSEGDFAETSFTSNLDDLHRAAAFLAESYQPVRFLVGHSLGGAAVLGVGGEIDSVRCIATIGAPSEPSHVRHLFLDADFGESGRAKVSIGGRPFEIGRGFVEDLERHDLRDDIASLRRPLLIFHSPVDTIVGVEHAERIFTTAKHPKSFVSLGNADHLVSNPEDAQFLGRMLSAWAHRYI